MTEPVYREDIGGLESILSQLDHFKRGVSNPQLYEIMGARPPKGFMLSGPPGVGKTYIAKYLAQELDARFVDLPLSDFESKWVGEAEKKLLQHLRNFKAYHSVTGKSVLVFFDEAEEIFKSRSMEGWHGPRVNALLREMDGLGNSEGIVFGAATNHLDRVDSAILRPGRLDYIIHIPTYDAAMLGDVFRAQRDFRNRKALGTYSPFKLSLDDCLSLGEYAKVHGLTPADVAEVYRRSIDEKVRLIIEDKSNKPVSKRAIHVTLSDIQQVLSSYRKKSEEKRRIGFQL